MCNTGAEHVNMDHSMKAYGHGLCSNGYYAGWDGLGVDSQEACISVCLEESQCIFAAWISGRSCLRFQEKSCILVDDGYHRDMTFQKTNGNTSTMYDGINFDSKRPQHTTQHKKSGCGTVQFLEGLHCFVCQ